MKKKKKLNIVIYYFLSFLYLELLFRFLMVKKVFAITTINTVLFVFFFAILMYIITKLFNKKVNKIIFYIILIAITVWFGTQFVIKDFFGFYMSFSYLKLADQIGNGFVDEAVVAVIKRLIPIFFILLPLILSIIFHKKLNFEKIKAKKMIVYIILLFISYGTYYISLNINKSSKYSAYALYHNVNEPSMNIEKVGVLNTFCIDTYRAIFGFNEKLNIGSAGEKLPKQKEEIKYDANTLKFDFETMLSENKDATVATMTEYFQNSKGTLQNEYTGKFKGKNLILFMGESFNEIAVDKDRTPTLYKLTHNGFVFNNFYTQTLGSTLGGEFQELTGLYANNVDLKIFRSGKVNYPMGLATIFRENGYNTFAYHDHYYTFQDRNVYLKSLGFDNFKGCNNGLETVVNCKQWPESDIEMIEGTVDDYINSTKPFMVFYAAVSGHGGYSWTGNMMAYKHKEEIMSYNYDYSPEVQAYLASQMEFDQALEKLVTKLEEAGKLDDTVIVIAGDHYPYMLTIDQINEVSSYTKDAKIEVNHSNLVIWNSKMDNVEVDKVAGQSDILPTVYNLFGLPYDSRLIVGNDILSTTLGLAVFQNRYWISDYGKCDKFDPTTGEPIYEGEEPYEGYADDVNNDVSNRIVISANILAYNYYDKIWKYKK